MGRGIPSSGLACAECAAVLPASAKFCLECGTRVSPVIERKTRRTVTLLFTDVTGSTAMGEQLDSEAYRDVMGRYFAIARAAIERHGGTVEKFVGDAVLAVFGIPTVHEDDALRAVRAAHELNDQVAELSDEVVAELGVRLAIRTGVNTGSVVAGADRAGGSFATGDAVNTAARLEQAAGDGEILLGATTYALVRDAVEAEAIEPVRAKGKAEPVRAHRLLAVLDEIYGRRRREDVALVGRVQESRTMDEALARTLSSGHSHRITVLGPAGIGKTRLVTEFLARVGDRAGVARGRCLAYGQGITYWPLVQALRDVLRLSGTESEEITRHALETALGHAPDRAEVVELLMPLVGRTGVPGGPEQTFWCVRRLLEELAAIRPLVLSVDDLHWAEPTLLELLDRLRDEVPDLPLLLLCQARPDLLDLYPGWDVEAVGAVTVRLDPLSLAETRTAVAALLRGDPPEGLADTVADWSGGNPLFIEEIVAHLMESGVLERQPRDEWRVARPLDRAEPPATVTALLASRLDRLPAGERELLEQVSVIGLEFETAQAEMLVEPQLRPTLAELLATLVRRDLVRPVRAAQGDSWVFKHVLVRDAAYDGMAKSLRAELHERFADGLTPEGVAGGDLAGFVAHHLEQAARYRRELAVRGPLVEPLVQRAVEALLVAADEARNRDREDTRIGYLERALALGPPASATRRRVLVRLSISALELGRLDLLGRTLGSLRVDLDRTADDLDRAFLRSMQGVHEMYTTGAADPAHVSAWADELVALGRATGDATWVVTGLRMKSVCSGALALWRDAAADSGEIIRIGSPADARDAQAMHFIAQVYGDGTLREARDWIHHELTVGGSTQHHQLNGLLWDALVAAANCSPDADHLIAAAAARCEELHAADKIGSATMPLLVDAYVMNRDVSGAIDYGQRVNDGYRLEGALANASTYILQQTLLMLERGDAAQLVAPLVDEGVGYTSPYDALSVACGTACRAILALRAGDRAGARRLAEDALGVIDQTHQVWQQADLRRALSEVPRATGDARSERRLLEEAAERYRLKEIHSYDPEISLRIDELGPVGA